MRGRRLAYPAARFVGGAARLEPLAVAGTVPCEHGVKLVPVDRTDEVTLRGLVPAQRRIGNREPEELRLRDRDVDELLAQLVVAEALDLPAHRLRGVLRVGIARAEHHDRRPPPALERILGHGPLRPAPLRDRKSTRLNSSHRTISYAVFCLKKKTRTRMDIHLQSH